MFQLVYYSTSIYRNAGFPEPWPIYCTIFLGMVQVIMTLLCVLIIDKVGRRILLIIGMSGMSVSAFAISLFSTLGRKVISVFFFSYLILKLLIIENTSKAVIFFSSSALL